MRIFVSGDWHFGHKKMVEAEHRPEDFEKRIIQRHREALQNGDFLIVLGDNALGKEGTEMLVEFLWSLRSGGISLATVRGNHDPDSISKGMSHGWGFVADTFTFRMFGKMILFTHEPAVDLEGIADLNIHGHLHNIDGHRGQLIQDGLHVLYSSELCDYRPVPLEFMATGKTPKWEKGRMVSAS